MTVKELIVLLKTFPPDTPVLVRSCSGFEPLGKAPDEFGEPRLETVIKIDDRYEHFYPERWREQVSNVLRAVVFPGD